MFSYDYDVLTDFLFILILKNNFNISAVYLTKRNMLP